MANPNELTKRQQMKLEERNFNNHNTLTLLSIVMNKQQRIVVNDSPNGLNPSMIMSLSDCFAFVRLGLRI